MASSPHSMLDVRPTFVNRLSRVRRLLWRDRSGVIGLSLMVAVVVVAILAPAIARHDPLLIDLGNSRLPPAWSDGGSWSHPFGTDTLGRDMFSRVIYGSRVSVTVGVFGVLIATSLGVVVGLIAGYFGGRVDALITGPVNLLLALPYLLIVVFIAAILGRSLVNVILILGVTSSPLFARVTRGEVMRIRESAYVESARCAGARWGRIVFDHILPNVIGPLITLASFEMSAMIFYEAGLGFLGMSVPPSVPSWGNMMAEGRKYLTNYPWLTTIPGLAVMFTSMGMNLTGDWLRDVLDPRLRRARR